MKNKYCLLLFLSLLLFSCNKGTYNDKISEKINLMLKSDVDNYDYVVIIPGSGCTGCITNAEDYFLNNVHNNTIKFIFTKIISKKNLQLKLQKDNMNKKNVYLDDNNIFYLYGFQEKIYPVIAKISNKKVITVNMLN